MTNDIVGDMKMKDFIDRTVTVNKDGKSVECKVIGHKKQTFLENWSIMVHDMLLCEPLDGSPAEWFGPFNINHE